MTLLPTSIPANLSHEAVDKHQNNTDASCNFELGSWVPMLFLVYILTISALGIILNVFVLVVFWFHKKACTVAEIYLSNLAAADLFLMSAFPVLVVVIAATKRDWQLSEILCKVFPFFLSMNADCSIYILALVSIDRYLALVHPLTNGRMRTPFYAKLACVLVWVVCFLLNGPSLIYHEVVHDPEKNSSSCDVKDPIPTMYLVFEGIDEFCCIIPISIISFCTVKIIHALRNRARNRSNTQKMEQKATTLVLVVLLVFLICWVPMHVVRILNLFSMLKILNGCQFDIHLEICDLIFTCLSLFNSVLNPILYVIVGKNFQTKVKGFYTQMSTNLSISQ